MNDNLKKSFIFFAIILGCFTDFISLAQNGSAVLDKDQILIGEQALLTLTLQYRIQSENPIHAKWGELNDSALSQDIEIISSTKNETSLVDSLDPYFIQQQKKLYITSFDSGAFTIPPIVYFMDSMEFEIETDHLSLQVNTVAIDTTKSIKAIKTIFEQEYTFSDWLKDNKTAIILTMILIIALAVGGYFLVRYLRNKPEEIAVAPPKKQIPAHITAITKLEKLKNEQVWQAGKYKDYYSELTDIFREYLDKRFNVSAYELTTEELLQIIAHLKVETETKDKIEQVLSISDLVKFAKANPLPTTNESCWDDISIFVNETKLVENTPDNVEETDEQNQLTV